MKKEHIQKQTTQFLSLFKHLVQDTINIFPYTILPDLLYSCLYVYVFGCILLVDYPPVQGMPYVIFFISGWLAMNVIGGSVSNMYRIANKIYEGSIEEILVSPMPSHVIILAFTCNAIVRTLPVVLLTLFVLFPLCGYVVPMQYYWSFLLNYFCMVSAFSMLGLIAGFIIGSFEKLFVVLTFINIFSFLSGSVFDLENGPEVLLTFAKVNPFYYYIQGMRESLFKGEMSITFLFLNLVINFVLVMYVKKILETDKLELKCL